MTQWLKALWDKIAIGVGSDTLAVSINVSNAVVRTGAAAFVVSVGVILLFYPSLNYAWAEPLADQMFRIATQLWNGAAWSL